MFSKCVACLRRFPPKNAPAPFLSLRGPENDEATSSHINRVKPLLSNSRLAAYAVISFPRINQEFAEVASCWALYLCHFERSEKSWPGYQDFSVAAIHFVRAWLLRYDKLTCNGGATAFQSAHESHAVDLIPKELSRITMQNDGLPLLRRAFLPSRLPPFTRAR